MDGHTDDQREIIIPRFYCVAGYNYASNKTPKDVESTVELDCLEQADLGLRWAIALAQISIKVNERTSWRSTSV